MYDMDNWDDEYDGPSRSQKKRDATALQRMGEELVNLGPDMIKKAGIPPKLRDALLESFNITKHEARRRHFQYVGKLMREVNTDRVEELLENYREGRDANSATFQEIESWRDRLLEGDNDLLQELVEMLPKMDVQHVRQLIRNAIKEKETNKPPKNSRTLFRLLRELREEQQAAELTKA